MILEEDQFMIGLNLCDTLQGRGCFYWLNRISLDLKNGRWIDYDKSISSVLLEDELV